MREDVYLLDFKNARFVLVESCSEDQPTFCLKWLNNINNNTQTILAWLCLDFEVALLLFQLFINAHFLSEALFLSYTHHWKVAQII